MTDHLELRIGEQTRAAGAIADRLPRITQIIDGLAAEAEATASGFRGAAAGGLAEALNAWFTAASAVPERLAQYAANLAAVDERTAASEETSSQTYSSLVTRMNGLIQ